MAFPTGYSKYQEITIDHTKVTGDLTDFVVFVKLADLVKVGSDIFDTCRSDGGDIRATKSDGTTQLPTDLVTIDTTAKTGELHIKFTGTLSSSTDTIIRIYYNGTDTALAATDTYGRNAVWSDFSAVYHLNEAVNNNAGGYADSTGTNPGTGVSMDEALRTGKIGLNAASFDGVNDYIRAADSASLDAPNNNNAVTLTAWLKSDSANQGTFYAFAKASDQYAIIFDFVADTYEFWGNSSGARFNIGTSSDTTNWLYLAASFNGATDEAIANFNGTTNTYTRTGSLPAANSQDFLIAGTLSGSTFSQAFDGAIDEIRVRASASSSNWLSTEYNNQNSPSTFYAVGVEQTGSTSITVNPVVQSITASIPAYTVKKGVRQSPTAQVITASLQAPVVRLPKTVSPAAQSIVASIPAYTVDAGGNVSVAIAAQTLTLSVPAYSILRDFVVSPAAQSLTLTTPAPSLSLGSGVVVSPDAQVATLSVIAPVITAQRSIIISVATQLLTLTLPTLAKVGGVWSKRARQTNSDWGARSRQTDSDWSRTPANDT